MAKIFRLIEVKTRKSQYSYLTKVAEKTATWIASFVQDNNIIPVVDILEK